MPKKYLEMVEAIKESCEHKGMGEKRCSHIAYGTATNYWKGKYGHAPKR